MRDFINWLCRHIAWGAIAIGIVWFAYERQRLDITIVYGILGVVVILGARLEELFSNATYKSQLESIAALWQRAFAIYVSTLPLYGVIMHISGGRDDVEDPIFIMLIITTGGNTILWLVMEYISILFPPKSQKERGDPDRGGPGDALSPVPVRPRPKRGHDTAIAKTPKTLADPEEVTIKRIKIHNRV